MLDLLAERELVRRNGVEPAGEAREGTDVRVDRRTPVILDQIVVSMDTIHRGAGGVHLVEKGKEVVYEVR